MWSFSREVHASNGRQLNASLPHLLNFIRASSSVGRSNCLPTKRNSDSFDASNPPQAAPLMEINHTGSSNMYKSNNVLYKGRATTTTVNLTRCTRTQQAMNIVSSYLFIILSFVCGNEKWAQARSRFTSLCDKYEFMTSMALTSSPST